MAWISLWEAAQPPSLKKKEERDVDQGEYGGFLVYGAEHGCVLDYMCICVCEQ